MAWRDSRRSRARLLLFISAMALGVAALVAIRSFGVNLERAVDAQAKTLLGADLRLSKNRSFTATDRALFDSLAATHDGVQAEEVSFASMALFPQSGGTRLVDAHAVNGAFPFYGEIETIPADAAERYQAAGEALVDGALMTQLDVAPGDSVRVGERTYRIAGAIERISGQTDIAALVGPRVYLPLAGLDSTLLGFGSRSSHYAYFQFPDAVDADAVLASVEPRVDALRLRTETVSETQGDWADALGYLYRFLSLVGFVALLLGGVGVASAVHVYVRQKAQAIATLRCLGTTSRQAFQIFLLQTAAMGFLGAALGAAVGVVVQTLLPAVLADFIPVDVQFRVVWPVVFEGVAIGLVVALLFALLPLVAVRHIPPLAALRTDAETPTRRFDPLRWGVAVLIGVGVVGFAWVQTGSVLQAVGFAVALGAVLLLLTGAAWLVARGAKALLSARWPFVLRQGIASLYRPQNQTVVLMLTLGLGTFLILTLWLVQQALVGQVSFSAGDADSANLVFFDIQQDQRDGIADLIDAEALPIIDDVPIVSMRLRSVKGRSVDDLRADTTVQVERWALSREYRSTYRDEMVDSETLLAGTFVGQAPDGDVVPISLEQDIAGDLGVALGDTIVWNVQSVPMTTVIASIREVDWQRVQPNFFAVFPTGVLERAPQFRVLSTRAPSREASAGLQRAVVQRYPNVSAIDVSLVIGVLQGVLDRVSFVLRFMALFSVLTGLVVLAGAVLISRFQRIEESVLLRTLGASQKQVQRINAIEYLALGALATLTGAVLAVGGAAALSIFVFEVRFAPSPWPLVAAFVVVSLLTLAVGWLGSRGLHRRPPLEVLRAET